MRRIDFFAVDPVNHQHLAPVAEIAMLVAVHHDRFRFLRGKPEASLNVLGGGLLTLTLVASSILGKLAEPQPLGFHHLAERHHGLLFGDSFAVAALPRRSSLVCITQLQYSVSAVELVMRSCGWRLQHTTLLGSPKTAQILPSVRSLHLPTAICQSNESTSDIEPPGPVPRERP